MFDLDPDLQEYFAAEQLLHVAPRVGSDQLQLLSAFADHHRLVAGLVDDDNHVDAAQLALGFKFLDHRAGAVGQFVAELSKQFLAHEFRREKAFAAVGHLACGIHRRLLRQVLAQRLQQLLRLLPALGADRHDIRKSTLGLQLCQQRQQQLLVGQAIDLV